MKKKLEVGKVGWDDNNPMIPIVLIDKKLRATLGINVQDIVRIVNGANKTLAMVHIQFWEFVGTKKISLNDKASKKLDVNVGEKITIDTIVTDEEKHKFMVENHPLAELFRGLSSN